MLRCVVSPSLVFSVLSIASSYSSYQSGLNSLRPGHCCCRCFFGSLPFRTGMNRHFPDESRSVRKKENLCDVSLVVRLSLKISNRFSGQLLSSFFLSLSLSLTHTHTHTHMVCGCVCKSSCLPLGSGATLSQPSLLPPTPSRSPWPTRGLFSSSTAAAELRKTGLTQKFSQIVFKVVLAPVSSSSNSSCDLQLCDQVCN